MSDIKDKILLYGNGINYFIFDLVKEKLNFNRLEIDEFIKSDYFNKFFTKNLPNRQIDEFRFSKNISFEEKFKELSNFLGLYKDKTPEIYKKWEELNKSFQNWLSNTYDKNWKLISRSKISIQKNSLYQKLQLKINEYDYLLTTNYIDSFPLISKSGKHTTFIHGTINENSSNILPLDGNMPWYMDKKSLFEDASIIDQYRILTEDKFSMNVYGKLKNLKLNIINSYRNIKNHGFIFKDQWGITKVWIFNNKIPRFYIGRDKNSKIECKFTSQMDIFGFSPINDDKLVESILISKCIRKINIYIYNKNYDLERKIWDEKINSFKQNNLESKKDIKFHKFNLFLK